MASAAFPTDGGPEVSANTNGVNKTRIGSACYAGVRFASDGDEDSKGSGNSWNNGDRGQWLDAGAASEVWVERTINSGTLNDEDAGTGRHQLSGTHNFSSVRSVAGVKTTNVTFDFYDAASGGNLLDSVTYDIIAEWGT